MSALAALAAIGAAACLLGVPRLVLLRRRLQGGRASAASRRGPRASPKLRARREAEVAELAGAVAAELSAGAVWEVAVRRAATALAADGAELGTLLADSVDLDHALNLAAGLPGAEGLEAFCAAGQLGQRTGARAAALVERVASALRARARAKRAVAVELAPAVSTARLLAGLPVIGLLMGAALGSDPMRVLLLSAPGRGCLVAAAVLEAAGLLWCRAIRHRALR